MTICLGGATWKPVRKLMNPMFNQQILQSFLPIFSERSIAMIKDMEKEVDKPAFNMLNYAGVCTLDSICCEYFFPLFFLTALGKKYIKKSKKREFRSNFERKNK